MSVEVHIFKGSTSILAGCYDTQARTLSIAFKKHPQTGYLYQGVTRDDWNAFKRARSAGRFYQQFIQGIYNDAEKFDLPVIYEEQDLTTLLERSLKAREVV